MRAAPTKKLQKVAFWHNPSAINRPRNVQSYLGIKSKKQENKVGAVCSACGESTGNCTGCD